MRVLLVVQHLRPGGTPRAAQTQAIAFRDLGHEAAVYAWMFGGPREANLDEAGITTMVGDWKDPEVDARVRQQALDWQPDVVLIHRAGHAHDHETRIMQAIAAHGAPPIIEMNHFARVDFSPGHNLIDVHLQLAPWCMWKYRQWSRGKRPRPISVVAPHLVDASAFYPEPPLVRETFRAEHQIPQDAFVFGRIGQAYEGKWSPMIFEAFRAVANSNPKAHLMLVGAPESYAARIANEPDHIRSRIICPPFLHGDAQLRAAYASMDVFLHAASIGESFGLVLTESMLCGVPVITLSTPHRDNSQIDVVGHERGGLVVNDVASMILAMRCLTTDHLLRTRLGSQGGDHVRHHYDVTRRAEHILRVMQFALHYRDRSALAKAIESDPDFMTDMDMDACLAQMAHGIGRPSLAHRLMMRLIHVPMVYRGVSLLRR